MIPTACRNIHHLPAPVSERTICGSAADARTFIPPDWRWTWEAVCNVFAADPGCTVELHPAATFTRPDPHHDAAIWDEVADMFRRCDQEHIGAIGQYAARRARELRGER